MEVCKIIRNYFQGDVRYSWCLSALADRQFQCILFILESFLNRPLFFRFSNYLCFIELSVKENCKRIDEHPRILSNFVGTQNGIKNRLK